MACSAFGGQQVLYERFFGGDPTRNALLLYRTFNRGGAVERVRGFLGREGWR